MKTDVLIVGGGPSGLAAAYEVASQGYKATIVDEAWSLGGQLRQQTQRLPLMPAPWTGLRGFEVADALVDRLRKSMIKYLLNHEVIGLFADGGIGIKNAEAVIKIEPACCIIATGAEESALSFPGWTLPGVMTVGAAQILINRERVYPGKSALVIGSSDMGLDIARQLHEVGIRVAGVVEAKEQLQAQDDEIIRSFGETGINVFFGTEVTGVTGDGRVEEVCLQGRDASSRQIKLPVDCVCVDGGRQPILELLSILNCSFQYHESLGGWVPNYQDTLQSNVDGIFVAGQAAGVTCHAGVLLTGAIAGISSIDYLQKKVSDDRISARRNYWEQLKQVESCYCPKVWQARMEHIKNFPG
jgi:NADPH-dependent 2,4-dienoyl-CoA reductase/sulfur reductase-like enzyme